jgi:phosphopantothenoylcysteine synthetase/decarboxylase
MLAVAWISALLLSPGYNAWMVTRPAVAPAVTVIEQEFVVIVQDEAESVTVGPLDCAHKMVSSATEPVNPDKVAVQVEGPPTRIDVGVHDTVSDGCVRLSQSVVVRGICSP